jgi:FOG: GAF domain
VPLTRNDGHLLGILSVDEPVSGCVPSDEELEVLVALAEHVALALESAQEGRVRTATAAPSSGCCWCRRV